MRSDRLRLKDLRLAYRLIGECRELGSNPYAWRMHMLDGLRAMTGAQLALCMHISARLGLSPYTVNRHLQRLYRRFGVHSRTALMSRCWHMLEQLRCLQGSLRTTDGCPLK
jgi:hypothetical protein